MREINESSNNDKSAWKAEPGDLILWGVSPISMDLFEKIEKKFKNVKSEEIDSLNIYNLISSIIKKKGIRNFLQNRMDDTWSIPGEFQVKCISELYRHTYLIKRKLEKQKEYSVEEISFLYFDYRINKEIREWLEEDKKRPLKFYLTRRTLRLICEDCIFVIEYLKELGFNYAQKNVKLYNYFEKFTKIKEIDFYFDERLKDLKIHDYVKDTIKELKEELLDRERKLISGEKLNSNRPSRGSKPKSRIIISTIKWGDESKRRNWFERIRRYN